MFLTIESEMATAKSESVFEAAVVLPGKGERTAQRIRAVALDQFSRLGFERVTMADIAAAVGVSQPTLHYHFIDKLQLWQTAMRDLSAVIVEEERMLDAARDVSPLERIRLAMRFFIGLSWRHPALARIVMLEGMAGGERLEWLDRHVLRRRNHWLVRLVNEAIAAGTLRHFPPEQIVITLQTAAVGVICLAPLLQTSFGIDPETPAARAAHEEMIIDALLGGLEIKPPTVTN